LKSSVYSDAIKAVYKAPTGKAYVWERAIMDEAQLPEAEYSAFPLVLSGCNWLRTLREKSRGFERGWWEKGTKG
jgi:hypothetical protein